VKHLLLLRHAKAAAAERGMADRDRPLTSRGHRDARLMASAIASGGSPDLILCSPARRTRETLDEIVGALGAEPKVIIASGLYGTQSGTYADIVGLLGDASKRLLVIGHNPTIHATALAFAGKGARAQRAALAAKFPTSSLAVIALEGDTWSAIKAGTGELVSFVRPCDLGASDAND
jgi:phosphohistidine phosphatase